VLLRELFRENAEPVKKKVGRAFNHLEDLTFMNGSAGAIKALEHVKQIGSNSGAVRLKWDGAPQVYWGWYWNPEIGQHQFVTANHNGWLRGGSGTSDVSEFTSQQGIYNFILNRSGSAKTPDEQAQRELFAREFSFIQPLLEKATKKPKKNKSLFFYADGLFLQRPTPDANGVYNLHPNQKSKTVYHIAQDTSLGQRIQSASVMMVGHGMFSQFGAADEAQQPVEDFAPFIDDSVGEVIVLGPYYTQIQPQVDTESITTVEEKIKQQGGEIDNFLSPLPGVAGFKNIIYRYVNTMSKEGNLHNVAHNFMNWIQANQNVVSPGQYQKIEERTRQFPGGLTAMFGLFTDIMQLKNHILAQLDADPGEIKVTNSEGWVHYDKKGNDHIKMVPRHDIDTPAGNTIPAWVP